MSEVPEKKGKPWLWVLVGCGVILVIVLVAVGTGVFFVTKKVKDFASNPAEAVAKMVTMANPEVEVVEIDEKNQTITLRNKKTGEVLTMDFSEAQKGKFQWKTKEGKTGTLKITGKGEERKVEIEGEGKKMVISSGGGETKEVPSWVPTLSGGKLIAKILGTAASEGTLTYQTQDSPQDVLSQMEKELKKKGFTTSTHTYTQNGTVKGGMVQGEKEDLGQNIQVVVTTEGGTTSCVITFEEER